MCASSYMHTGTACHRASEIARKLIMLWWHSGGAQAASGCGARAVSASEACTSRQAKAQRGLWRPLHCVRGQNRTAIVLRHRRWRSRQARLAGVLARKQRGGPGVQAHAHSVCWCWCGWDTNAQTRESGECRLLHSVGGSAGRAAAPRGSGQESGVARLWRRIRARQHWGQVVYSPPCGGCGSRSARGWVAPQLRQGACARRRGCGCLRYAVLLEARLAVGKGGQCLDPRYCQGTRCIRTTCHGVRCLAFLRAADGG